MPTTATLVLLELEEAVPSGTMTGTIAVLVLEILVLSEIDTVWVESGPIIRLMELVAAFEVVTGEFCSSTAKAAVA